jgi:outer membrane lipoprotein SlyB
MFRKIASRSAAFVLALTLSACATQGYNTSDADIRSGIIEQITPIQIQSNQHTGVGAVVGGLVGLGIGSLIGGGNGRDVAMVLGTVGGAYVGNEIQKKNEQPVQGQQIVVRTTSGVLVSVTQPVNPYLNQGQKVTIEGSGENSRVVPR